MPSQIDLKNDLHLAQFTSRKVTALPDDGFSAWMEHFQHLAVAGIRSQAVARSLRSSGY